ncbi:MAG TPA: trypsin-like peptidase domain-containing protein [Candidatus Acidoferrum sp.]|nr:trypsin-like peptidase domain-containing protein [Candidatus Acidoferrum sp.]
MNSNPKAANAVRLLIAGLMIALSAYWAGARWGSHEPANVEALQSQRGPGRGAGGTSGLTDEETRNINIYRQASPGVANINTQTVENDMFMRPIAMEGAGSGFVIDARGYLLTNYHVVENADTIEVTLGDKSQFSAKMVGYDPRNDVALLKIDPKGKSLTALTLADSSNLLVGQSVLAIGNPFRFSSTLTTGVISALGRTVQTSNTTFIDEAIQTDAAINQGNSGGPLLNSHGEVIGINSAIYTPSGTTAGIGFAIPIDTAKAIAHDLMTDGVVHRAYIGLSPLELWPDLADALDLPVKEGLLVLSVDQGGPAARAGLHGGNRNVILGMQRLTIGGDVIVSMDGRDVKSLLDLNVQLNHKRPGDTIVVSYYRAGKKADVTVTLTDQPQGHSGER